MDQVQQRSKPAVDLQGMRRQASCHSCRHSIGHAEGLWCRAWDCEAIGGCHEYEYEPGTDADE